MAQGKVFATTVVTLVKRRRKGSASCGFAFVSAVKIPGKLPDSPHFFRVKTGCIKLAALGDHLLDHVAYMLLGNPAP